MNLSEKQKQHILSGLITLSILPLTLINFHLDTLTSWSSAWLYISSTLGYFGIVLLLWMYILGTKSVMGLYFNDLAMIRKIHGRLGKYGLLFVFIHPIAATLSYGYNLLTYSLFPDLSSNYEVYVTYGRIAMYILAFVWITSALMRSKMSYRLWKYLHYVTYLALPLALLHIPTTGTAFASERLAQLCYFSILGLFVLFTLLRLRQLFMIGKSPFTVQMQTSATADVMYLQLRPASSRHISSKRGQFIYLQMNLLGEEHPFSAMQYDAKTGDITVAYKKFGPFTEKLSHLEAGDTVYIDGPYGVFTEQITPGYNYPVVMIAGGIGITPFVDHVLNGSSTDQWLFYANQTKASSAFINTLEMKLGNRLVPIYSGEQRPDGETGFIRAELFSKYLQNPTRYHYFVCGPPRMMEATKTALIGLGVSAEQIHSEDFSF